MDTGWRRNKYGGLFNINDYMNNKIRNIVEYDDNEEEFKQENQNVLYENQVNTDELKEAVREYTYGGGYGSSETMNAYLNGTREMSESAGRIVVEKSNVLESGINQPLKHNIYVYRSIGIKPSELREGQVIENKGFTSTSLTMSKAGNFNVGFGAMIKLKVNKGTKALYIGDKTSAHNNEHELLFGKNHSIKIVKIDKLYDKDGDFMNYEVLGELN